MNPSEHIEPTGEFLLYETEDGRTHVECRFINETLWLTQSGMAELYQTTKLMCHRYVYTARRTTGW